MHIAAAYAGASARPKLLTEAIIAHVVASLCGQMESEVNQCRSSRI